MRLLGVNKINIKINRSEMRLLMKENKLFPCYSIPLKEFLKSKGIRYELRGLHPDSKLMFWIYMRDEKLNECLKEWKETKPNN